MTAGGGDLEGSTCVRLAADIGHCRAARDRHRPGVRGLVWQSLAATQMAGDSQQMSTAYIVSPPTSATSSGCRPA